MKKVLFGVLALAATFMVACGPTQDQAIEFNDKVVELDEKAYESFTEYEDAIFDGDMDAIDEWSETLKADIEAGIAFLEEDSKFDGEFKDAAMGMFEAYKVSHEEYMPIMVEYWTSDWDSISDELEEEEQEAYDAMNELIDEKSDAFIETQEAFAEEWGFDLI